MFCRYHKWRISLGQVGGPSLPKGTRAHLERCPACREIYDAEHCVIQQLRTEALLNRESPSPFLHTRIVRALDGRSQPEEGAAVGPRYAMAAGLVAIIVVVLTMVWVPQNSIIRPTTEDPVAADRSAEIELASLFRLPDPAALREYGQKLNQPLEAELQLVVSDAKSAALYLANNFLPERFEAFSTTEER